MKSGCILWSIPVSVCACGGAERIFTFSGEIWFGFGAEKGSDKVGHGRKRGSRAKLFFFFFFVVFAAAAPLADDAHSFGWTRRGGTLRGVLLCFLFIDLLQFDVYVGGARELFMPKPTEHLF